MTNEPRPLIERLCPAALFYARRGLRVHPLRPGTKLPILDKWQDRATTDIATVQEWWREHRLANIGLATGAGSGVVVIDVDVKAGRDGRDSLHDLEAGNGELPSTWQSETANGGQHRYFAHPGGHVGNRAGLRPGIDVRGDGGYIVAAPSMLDGGREYLWFVGYGPHELPLAQMPAWLAALLVERGNGHGGSVEDWHRVVTAAVAEGKRNDAIARLAGLLLRRRLGGSVTLEFVRAWNHTHCQPPLADDEVIRTVESIAAAELRRRKGAR